MDSIVIEHAWKRLGECELGSVRFYFWCNIIDGIRHRS